METIDNDTTARRPRAAAGGPQPVTSPTRAEVRGAFGHLRTEIDNRMFAAKLLVWILFTVVGAVLALRAGAIPRLTGVIVLGCMFAHAAELQHQTLHSLGFRNRRANLVAGVVLGVPMLISFSAYRATHMRHHRDLGTPANREFFDYGDQYGAGGQRSRSRVAWDWTIRFSMLHHYGLFIQNCLTALRRLDYDGETATVARRIRRDHYLMMALLTLAVAVSVWSGTAYVVWLWLLPLLLVAGPVHALVELPEHFRCETLNQDVFANTRTIRSNRLMMWFTNGNNFHVEHHLMPNLPIEQLPDLHVEIRDSLRNFHPGYVDFFRKLVRR